MSLVPGVAPRPAGARPRQWAPQLRLLPVGLGRGRKRRVSWTSSPPAVAPVACALQVAPLCQLPPLQEPHPQLRSLPVEEVLVLRALSTSAQDLLELMALRGPRCSMQLMLALREPQLRRVQGLLEGALLLEGEVVVLQALSLVLELLEKVLVLQLLLTLREPQLRAVELRLAAK